MNTQEIVDYIVAWLEKHRNESNQSGFVIGVSGGIDSAVTSTLCALTGAPVMVINMPIHQAPDQIDRSNDHIAWLQERFESVQSSIVDLTTTYESFVEATNISDELSLANTRSRLRMTTLYAYANLKGYLVAGTGNKVEDYGVGFFTKYGDGGVDLSPIASLLKSEVYKVAAHLEIIESIRTATPTDGLWGDNRSDEDQIGAIYNELEWALQYYDLEGSNTTGLSSRQREVLRIYTERHLATKHKLEMPPMCEFSIF